jgi:hypothetical protein
MPRDKPLSQTMAWKNLGTMPSLESQCRNESLQIKLPVWRNGRRTGLKIFKIALSDHFSRLLLTRVSAFIYKPIFNFSLISPHR